MLNPTSPAVHAFLGLRAMEAREGALLEQHELRMQLVSIPGSTLGCQPAITPVPTTGPRLALHSSCCLWNLLSFQKHRFLRGAGI